MEITRARCCISFSIEKILENSNSRINTNKHSELSDNLDDKIDLVIKKETTEKDDDKDNLENKLEIEEGKTVQFVFGIKIDN